MKYVIHNADSRGHVNFGWLDSYHSFSFGSYYNPEKMHFGMLRVLNDDVVAPSKGFGLHPHDNMEIISIPLEGDLEHRDNMGNTGVIKSGDIQVMSAGTGIQHSEYNHNGDKAVKFLQIWIYPHTKQLTPRYDQAKINIEENELHQIVSPTMDEEGVWIHQNAWLFMGNFSDATSIEYKIKARGNGLYIFVIEGKIKWDNTILNKRDALGIWECEKTEFKVEQHSKILILDVPMQ